MRINEGKVHRSVMNHALRLIPERVKIGTNMRVSVEYLSLRSETNKYQLEILILFTRTRDTTQQ